MVEGRLPIARGDDDFGRSRRARTGVLNNSRGIVFTGQMSQKEVCHEGRAMTDKKLEGLIVGKVTFLAADAALQRPRITALHKHVLIVISFQKCCVALPKIMNYVVAS